MIVLESIIKFPPFETIILDEGAISVFESIVRVAPDAIVTLPFNVGDELHDSSEVIVIVEPSVGASARPDETLVRSNIRTQIILFRLRMEPDGRSSSKNKLLV